MELPTDLSTETVDAFPLVLGALPLQPPLESQTANMTDTWYFHASSLQEEQLLFTDPVRFFSELYLDPYGDGKWKLLGTENSFWNDLKANALIKGLALLNLITGGHYLVNVLFYNFIGMFGRFMCLPTFCHCQEQCEQVDW